MNLYRNESSTPKWNAQRNLQGRSHYVEDDSLRFHKSRILETTITDDGLLFALVESVALDMNNTSRGFRPVVFDVFGNTIDRQPLDAAFSTRKAASKAMWLELNAINAQEHTLTQIERERESHNAELDRLIGEVLKLDKAA